MAERKIKNFDELEEWISYRVDQLADEFDDALVHNDAGKTLMVVSKLKMLDEMKRLIMEPIEAPHSYYKDYRCK